MANYFNPKTWFEKNPKNPDKNEELDSAIRRAALIDQVGDTRERKTDDLAVSTVKPEFLKTGDDSVMGIWKNDSFRQYISFNFCGDKVTRLMDYREMGKHEKIDACLHEISISCLASHHDKEPVVVKLEGDYDETVVEIVNKELKKVVNMFKFDRKGQEAFREFLVTGELAWENVFSVKRPELGILDVKAIPPENLDPVYRNFYNQEVEMFMLRKPNQIELNSINQGMRNTNRQSTITFDTIPMARSQVTYCNSGEWDRNGAFVIPYLMKGQAAQKKLSLIEDAIVINAMVNAPERLLWNIPVGNMDGPTKDSYMRNVIKEHKRKKGTDSNGNITDKYNPMGITEDFYIPVSQDGQSATVTRLAGSGAFGSGFNGMLEYFHQKVYEDMHVPVTRLNPDTGQSDGATITMQELAFAERIIAIQKKLAAAVKDTLIVHLKLKGLKLHNESCQHRIILRETKQGATPSSDYISEALKFEEHLELVQEGYYGEILAPTLRKQNMDEETLLHELGQSYWDQYELKEMDINVEFSLPTNFLALREQQMFDLKWNNFNNLAGSGFFSPFLLAKKYLDMTDKDLLQHMEWKKKEAIKNWELSQIEANGPDFREVAAAEAGVDTGGDMGGSLGGGGGGSALPSGGGIAGGLGGGDVPDFGGEGGELDDLDPSTVTPPGEGGAELPEPGGEGGAELPEPPAPAEDDEEV